MAEKRGLTLNSEAFETLKAEAHPEQVVDFIIDQYRDSDEQQFQKFMELENSKKINHSNVAFMDKIKPAGKTFHDLNLLDSVDNTSLSAKDVPLAGNPKEAFFAGGNPLEQLKPTINPETAQALFGDPSHSQSESGDLNTKPRARTHSESVSSDTSDMSNSMNQTEKRPANSK